MARLTREQRREELVEAAIRVIARDGLAKATVRAIVQEADMPLGAFHFAFDSREELIATIIEHVSDKERMAAWMWAHVPTPAPGPSGVEALIRVGLEGYLTLLVASPSSELALLEVGLHAVRHEPDAVRAQWAVYIETSRASLERAAQLARVRWSAPIDELAANLTQAVDGLTLTWLATRDDAAARAFIAAIARLFAGYAEPLDPTTPVGAPADTTREEGQHAHHP